MPIKLFEYLSYQKPIFITDGSAGAEFVRNNNIGVVVQPDEESIKSALQDISSHRDRLTEISVHMEAIAEHNSRARTVEAVLCSQNQKEEMR